MVMAAAAFGSHGSNVATIQDAYLTLQPLFGPAAATVFGITLLASGLSSSTTATIAGQAIMEGMLGRKMNLWIRRIVTRLINTIPTTIAILAGIEPLLILVYSQVALSLLVPLPLLPLLILTNDKKLMGSFVNRRITTILAAIFIGIIILFNGFLLYLILG
jgi:manganese transport protein